MNSIAVNYLTDRYGVHTMNNKVKKRVDSRPALTQNMVGDFLQCQLCNQEKKWKGGSFTRHLQSIHQLTTSAYYVQIYGDKWRNCLCGCGEETTWESREGYYKAYVSGHNYRGKTKENDLTVGLRTEKMMQSNTWKNSTFNKGSVPWNKCSTDLAYIEKLFNKTKFKLKVGGIKKGIYITSDLRSMHYDSSWELDRMRQYDADKNIKHWDRCKDVIQYTDINGQVRHYNPDFEIHYNNENVVIEEIKGGLFRETALLKLIAANAYYSNTNKQFTVITKRNKTFITVPIDFFINKKR